MTIRVSPSLLNQFTEAMQAAPEESPALHEKLVKYIKRESGSSFWGTLGTNFHACMTDPIATAVVEEGEVVAWGYGGNFYSVPFMLEALAAGWHPDMVFGIWGSKTVEIEPGLACRVVGVTDANWDDEIVDWKMVSFDSYWDWSNSWQHVIYLWLLEASRFRYIIYPYKVANGVPVLTEKPYPYTFYPQAGDEARIVGVIRELVDYARTYGLMDYLIDKKR